MRRKKKKRRISIKIIFLIMVFMTAVSFGYSYLSSTLGIGGQVIGMLNENNYTLLPTSDPSLNIMISKVNNWQDGSLYSNQYSLKITNIGQATINNLKITLDFINSINSVSIGNYDYTINDKILNITSSDYVLAPQQSFVIEIIVSSSSAYQIISTVKLELVKSDRIVTLDEFDVKFNIANSWGQYTYQYDIVVTNKTGSKINGWQLDISLPSGTTYMSGWNAIYNYSNGLLTINNESYNGILSNMASITIGLQLSTNIINFIPSNIKVTVR